MHFVFTSRKNLSMIIYLIFVAMAKAIIMLITYVTLRSEEI